MEAAGETSSVERSRSNAPTFSAQHPMIPKLYVLPWQQDMKNQLLLMKNAALAGILVDPHHESLCFCARERLSSSPPSPPSPLDQTIQPAHRSSPFSRYNSSVVTLRRLFQN